MATTAQCLECNGYLSDRMLVAEMDDTLQLRIGTCPTCTLKTGALVAYLVAVPRSTVAHA